MHDCTIMRCSICGIQIDPVNDAFEPGWCPYFYEGADLHDVACPSCTDILLSYGEDGELELKEEYRGKVRYLDRPENEARQGRQTMRTIVLESEPGKLN